MKCRRLGNFILGARDTRVQGQGKENMRTKLLLTILIITAATLLLSAMPAHAIDDYETSLKGYWKLDDAVGQAAADASGNGNTGTVIGATQQANGVPGYSGKAYSFNGANLNQVIIADSPSMNSGSLTVSGWVYMDSYNPTASSTLIQRDNVSTVSLSYRDWALFADNGNFSPNPTATVFVGAAYYQTSGARLTTGEWHHLVMTYDQETLTLYVDSAYANSTTKLTGPAGYVDNALSGPVNQSTSDIVIGSYPGDHGLYGRIDDVAMWNRALSYNDGLHNDEIDAIYDFGVKMYAGVAGGLEDLSLLAGYNAQDRYNLTNVYNSQNVSCVSIEGLTWYYTPYGFSGSHNYGDGWTEGGYKYIMLGSGLTTNQSYNGPLDAVPEPATVVSIIGLVALGVRRIRRR
jgi:hypothetical protein